MIDIYKYAIDLLPRIGTRRYYRAVVDGDGNYVKWCTISGVGIPEQVYVTCSAKYSVTAANKRVVELDIEVFIGDQHVKRHQVMLYRAKTDAEKMDREFVNEMLKFAKKVRGKKNARK